MDERIYRQKSLDRISSPEALGDYLRVTSPAVWLILTAIILLLVGMLIWSSVASIDSFAGGTAVVDNGTMTIRFDDREAVYSYDMLSQLEPAYAMTVHKSQGSEYRAVVLVAWRGTPLLLSRSILYTAVTRARELLIVVGDEGVIEYMVRNDKKQKRFSGLKWRLCHMEA